MFLNALLGSGMDGNIGIGFFFNPMPMGASCTIMHTKCIQLLKGILGEYNFPSFSMHLAIAYMIIQ